MRILIVTQWFDPELALKGRAFARSLVDAGHDVEVITGFPNYPTGRIYPGYRLKLLERSDVDGFRLNRVFLFPSRDANAVARVLNYVSFMFTATLFATFGARRPDVIYAYHPPLTTGIAAAIAGFWRRSPVVYDIQDLWPDTLSATGMIRNGVLMRLVGSVCDRVYRRMARIVVLSPGFRERLIERGVPAGKIEVIFNWADEAAGASMEPQVGRHAPSKRRFQLLFAGNMGKGQGLTSVIEAAEILQDARAEIDLVFVGSGLERAALEAMAARRKLTNVVFRPAVPVTEMPAIFDQADALLVHLRDDPLFAITIPSKTQAYLAAGKPILMATRGDSAQLVERAGAGVVAEPGNPVSIAAAVALLAGMGDAERARLGAQGRMFYERELSFAVGAARFEKLFCEVAAE
ncbi:glycosyltransferase family 4 protein [Brevundimonas sp. Root1423]|uniref:glycosyltransferase family 4 protein n=1 Tax=Brevundimonas sp. Root1423 TaxID=1736462 RepID=UPI0006F78900|nr:glycosyltransferase family 4 protein [Brevundimonas sp. Root1423]KQY84844.1 glycosyltransferase [Brevundimonas sp. Root1423]